MQPNDTAFGGPFFVGTRLLNGGDPNLESPLSAIDDHRLESRLTC